MSERDRRQHNLQVRYQAKYEKALRRRFDWFCRRRDYWLDQGDLERAVLLDKWAMYELDRWQRVNPLAELIVA